MLSLNEEFEFQVMDSILEILFLHKDYPPLNYKEIQNRIPLRLSVIDISRYTAKLTQEGFIKKSESEEKFLITYEGTQLFREGGYSKDTKRKKLKKILQITMAAIGIAGTLVSLVYSIIQIL